MLLTFCLHFTASCTIKDILMTQVEIAVEYFLVHGLQHYQHKDSGTVVQVFFCKFRGILKTVFLLNTSGQK